MGKAGILTYQHYDLENPDSFLLLFRIDYQHEEKTETLHYYQLEGSFFLAVKSKGKKELENLEEHNKSTLLSFLSLMFIDFFHSQLNLWEQWVIEKLRRESFALQKKKTCFQSLGLRNLRSYGEEGQRIEFKPKNLLV